MSDSEEVRFPLLLVPNTFNNYYMTMQEVYPIQRVGETAVSLERFFRCDMLSVAMECGDITYFYGLIVLC
jgi:hypothetical protein